MAEALTAQGVEVEKSAVRMPDLIKSIGEYAIEVAPHPDVVVGVTVCVIGEQ